MCQGNASASAQPLIEPTKKVGTERQFCLGQSRLISSFREPPASMLASEPDPRKYMLRSMWWHSMDDTYKIIAHLKDLHPNVGWYDVFKSTSGFCTYKNSIRDLEVIAQTCGKYYKWGATANLDRRIHELGLVRQFSHLFFIVTSGISESAGMEKALIAWYSQHPNDLLRLRCINNTKGGEGLGNASAYLGIPHFLYLAIK